MLIEIIAAISCDGSIILSLPLRVQNLKDRFQFGIPRSFARFSCKNRYPKTDTYTYITCEETHHNNVCIYKYDRNEITRAEPYNKQRIGKEERNSQGNHLALPNMREGSVEPGTVSIRNCIHPDDYTKACTRDDGSVVSA